MSNNWKNSTKSKFKVVAISSVYPTKYKVVDQHGYILMSNIASKSRAEQIAAEANIKAS